MSEPVKFEDTCTIGRVHFAVPAGFQLKVFDAKRDHPRGAAGLGPEEIYASWEAAGGESICAHYWPEQAPEAAAEIVAAREWQCEAAGMAIRIAETEKFMGAPQRLLATRFEIRRGGEYLIYCKGLTDDTFESILRSMRVA